MSIWEFSALVSDRLLTWSAFSTLLGLGMSLRKSAFWRGVGSQFIGWAVIDAGIAIVGDQQSAARRELPDANTPTRLRKEANNLRALLWFNAGLDILYMIGGLFLMGREKSSQWMRGVGLGVLLQGAFLFIFDYFHAGRVPDHRDSK